MNNFFEMPQFLCLETLVGISKKDCECLATVPDEKKELVQTSQTGLYVDEHDGAVSCLFLEKAKCFDGDVWDRLIHSRKEAVLQMMLDISVQLDNRFSTIPVYSHHLGEMGYSSLLNVQSGLQKINFKTANYSGAKMRFTAVGLIGKLLGGIQQETVRITILNKTKNITVSEFDFDVKMRVRTFGSEPDATMYDMPNIILDCDGSEYEINYNLDTSRMLVYDNMCTCRCEGVWSNLRKYFEVLPDGNAKGLIFNVHYFCDENYLLCALSNNVPTLRFLIAEGIRCLTMYKFLNNTKSKAGFGATIENVLNLSEIEGLMNAFSGKYSQVIADIEVKAKTMPNFGCFTCNTYNHARREGIFTTDTILDAQKNLHEIYEEVYQKMNDNRQSNFNPFL